MTNCCILNVSQHVAKFKLCNTWHMPLPGMSQGLWWTAGCGKYGRHTGLT